jgi:S-adenosylmethionine synthetase
MCRYIAKNIVAAGLAERCEIQIAYTIGKAEPVSLMVDTHGTGVVPSAELTKMVKKEFDLRPRPIIEQLDLLRPIYKKTACFGHFGRELEEFTWEKTDLVDKMKKAI